MKIIIDTNIWVSYFLFGSFTEMDYFLEDTKFEFVFSEELLDELVRVLKRPKFKEYINPERIEAIRDLFQEKIETSDTDISINECRDPGDLFLLSLIKKSGPDYLVTGDEDLLVIKQYETTRILNWKEFLKQIKK